MLYNDLLLTPVKRNIWLFTTKYLENSLKDIRLCTKDEASTIQLQEN